MFLCAAVFFALPFALQADDGPDFLDPTPEAQTSTAYWSKSTGDLRYMWQLPEEYSAETPRHMTVILHGTGGDYRWGYFNNFTEHHRKLNPLRTEDILISVDGTSPGNNGTRLFLGEDKDVESFREFLVEMREKFSVDKIFLYGHSQGSFFVVHFAADHADMLGGVVAHASGVWGWTKIGRKMRNLPIVFLHGTKDPVVGYRQSVGGRDHLLDEGMELVALMRMPGYNHWPNSMRVSEAIDWCEGMTSQDPQRVLDLAQELARQKGPDSYQYEIAPALALSRQVVRRLLDDGHSPVKEVSPKVAKQGAKLAKAIEKHGSLMVKELGKFYKKKITLDGDKPLGLLVAVREDYRGVDSVEAWYKKIGYDKMLKKHKKIANELHSVWWNSKKESELYAATVDAIGSCFLVEELQWNMQTRMEEWNASSAGLRLDKKTLERYEDFETWVDGWELGDKEYKKLWMKWEWKN